MRKSSRETQREAAIEPRLMAVTGMSRINTTNNESRILAVVDRLKAEVATCQDILRTKASCGQLRSDAHPEAWPWKHCSRCDGTPCSILNSVSVSLCVRCSASASYALRSGVTPTARDGDKCVRKTSRRVQQYSCSTRAFNTPEA
eukprot:6197925-Pleurochrysis_carterae.AAC.2